MILLDLHTQLLVFINCLLFSDLEAFCLLDLEFILGDVGHVVDTFEI